ncbi:SDR family oxidoreductase [Sphingobium nicotianae]|uniref:SDR family oxidoreductase n=1 Tax=Sphingobium nicotianae TaxID=2782607 RepID=A0A9X1IRT7_9SPHN|nr:SDR family oxidoreductase [Sphingobium nicotianae]MBT2187831.1 SDR family oxidoreductase [Sphingobium nicotianae]
MASPIMLVTGGSRGIGAAIARLAAERGYDVALTYTSKPDEAEQVATEIRGKGRRALVVKADLGVEADIVRMFEEVDTGLGRLTCLVNNAGILPRPSRLADADWADLRRVMEINLLGAEIACLEAIKRMSTKRGGTGGSIVLMGSRAGFYGAPGRAIAYATSKGALDAFTYGLGKEVAAEGIRVNIVSPGPISTDMNNEVSQPDRIQEIPMGRYGRADEVAKAVLFLASDEASFTSSASLMVSGAR